MPRPVLAITMGDPAGIGPETIVGAWSCSQIHTVCKPLVIGNCEVMQRAVQLLQTPIDVIPINSPDDAQPSLSSMPCLSAGSSEAACVQPATMDARGGQAAYDAVVSAARLAQAGSIAGLVTAPLNKTALYAAGHHFPGHTELLTQLCGAEETAMMLYLPAAANRTDDTGWGIVHVTLHMSLRDVFLHLHADRIVTCAHLANTVMRRLRSKTALAPPRIGLCALNPHAGENGIFGKEEQNIIVPAAEQARAAGIDVSGPYPADSLMVRARDGEFDALVAMYHDQGHIAMKLLGMHRAVNITLGLPVVRTSVAYGTAFDRAWKGSADSGGMVEAISVAARLACSRQLLSTTSDPQ